MKNKGFSLIEMIILMSIIGILSAVVISNLSGFKKQQALKNTTEDVVALLNEARNSTISSKNSANYGVRLESNKATLFQGTIFSSNSSNKQINFDSTISLSSASLHGGGDSIYFDKITGATSKYGTITLVITSTPTKSRVITVSSLGVISVN